MRRLRLALPVFALSGLLALGAAGDALACLPGDDDSATFRGPAELIALYYGDPDEGSWDNRKLDAELEGLIVVDPASPASPALVTPVTDGGEGSLLLMAMVALAAPVFAASSVTVYALRSRHR